MYIVLAAFVSGMGVAVDSTAGERERSTLEALLINPVDRSVFVTGKWLAAAGFASVGVILTMLLCVIVLQHIPLEELGLKFQVTPMQVIAMVLATFPLAFLATSMQLLLGIFAKSFKDAQSYIGFLVFLPMAPAIFTVFNPIATQTWMFAIPCLGQHLLLTDVMGGKPVPAVGYVLSAISTMIVAAGLVQVTARFFKRESIIFS
jgi:sodium transport system permease protein